MRWVALEKFMTSGKNKSFETEFDTGRKSLAEYHRRQSVVTFTNYGQIIVEEHDCLHFSAWFVMVHTHLADETF